MEYLLKSILCLLLLLLFYRIFLQQEVLYRFNRFFLLGAVVISFLIPVITLEVEQEVQAELLPEIVYSEEKLSLVAQNGGEVILDTPIRAISKLEIPWVKIVWGVYFLGFLVFLTRFIRNIRIIRTQIQRNLHVSYRGETLVLLREMVAPFSFLKYIFYHKGDFEKEGIPEAIFIHEQCHIREKHSWDILFLEVLLIVFWFHPGLHFALQVIRLNHELIADQEVIQKTPITDYQNLLISIISGQKRVLLGSNLNFSLTKKRLQMMNKKTSTARNWIKISVLIPFVLGVIYLFGDRVMAQKPNESRLETKAVNLSTKSPEESSKLGIYLMLYGDFQTKANENRVFSQPSNEEIENLRKDFDLVQAAYFNLRIEERRKVQRLSFPYAKIEKDGMVTYKKWEDLSEEERKTLGC